MVRAFDTFGKRLNQAAIAFCLVTFVNLIPLASGEQNASKATPESPAQIPNKPAPSTARDETRPLEDAFSSAAGNPQALIKNLQNFLAQFPESPRREQVLRAILQQAVQSNDPQAAIDAAEKLLELHPQDPALLSTLIDLLRGRHGTASREEALPYAQRLVERAEKLGTEPTPADWTLEKWQQAQAMLRSMAYFSRGQIYSESGETQKALADYEKSFAVYPSARVAEQAGDLAARAGMIDRAIHEYATALAFPEQKNDVAHHYQLRKKLGSVYMARYHSEKGLGDVVLARYDELMRTLAARFPPQEAGNTAARDPFDYVLARPDGPALRLADYRGKVVVMDFWATWCGPCKTEGKLLEQVMQNFRQEPRVIFLAVNVDEERDSVPRFIKDEAWTVPVVYGKGLDQLLGVRALPTLVIFDQSGRVVFRQEGLEPGMFVETLERKLGEVLRTRSSS